MFSLLIFLKILRMHCITGHREYVGYPDSCVPYMVHQLYLHFSLSLVVVVHHVYDTWVSKDMLVWSMTRCLGCMDQGMSSFIEEQRYGHVAYAHFCLVL